MSSRWQWIFRSNAITSMITRAICVHSKMIGVNAEVFIYILSLVDKLLCPEWDGFTLGEIFWLISMKRKPKYTYFMEYVSLTINTHLLSPNSWKTIYYLLIPRIAQMPIYFPFKMLMPFQRKRRRWSNLSTITFRGQLLPRKWTFHWKRGLFIASYKLICFQ